MSSGSFADFLNALREFDSGIDLARLEQNRAERIDNEQGQSILDTFRSDLDQIENGLAPRGMSLDDIIGQTITVIEADGTQSGLQLSVSGILATAHLRGASETLDFLVNGTITADETGIIVIEYLEKFGGFDAPPIADLRAGNVDLDDDGRAIGGESTPPADNDNDLEDTTAGNVVTAEIMPDDPSEIFLSVHNFVTESFSLTGTSGAGDDNAEVIFAFDNDDFPIVFASDDLQDLDDANGSGSGIAGSEAGDGALQGGIFDRFVFAAADGEPIKHGIDLISFSAQNDAVGAITEEEGDALLNAGAYVEGVSADDLVDGDLPDDDFDILAN